MKLHWAMLAVVGATVGCLHDVSIGEGSDTDSGTTNHSDAGPAASSTSRPSPTPTSTSTAFPDAQPPPQGVDGGTDATVSDAPACAANGAACTIDVECCSHLCVGNVCATGSSDASSDAVVTDAILSDANVSDAIVTDAILTDAIVTSDAPAACTLAFSSQHYAEDPATCDTCMQQNCCAQNDACGANPDCVALVSCAALCEIDGGAMLTCESNCTQQHAAGMTTYLGLMQCMTTDCSIEACFPLL